MVTKDKPTNLNTNGNVNTNTTNVHVNVGHSKKKSSKSKPKHNWFSRAIVVGIISLALSIFGYYIKQNLDKKGKDHPTTIESTGTPVQGKKQN